MRQTPTRLGMRRLSALAKPDHDRYYTLAILGFMLLAMVAGGLAWRDGHTSWLAMLGVWSAPAIAILATRGRRLLAPPVIDEVLVEDGDLLLKRGEESDRAPLENIAMVEAERRSNLVTLELDPPCVFGDRVHFITRRGAAGDIGAELRQRIAEARRHA
ncbi:hypothetical protein IHE49_12955 [Rhodanobacter sp. 7MK24]|uniref:hypothetical protein n=1 Tax=Rhodanobacter sp. 7MK24 TaxID=2775922 RepID=UPI0017810CDE|nr:hypothetical protein [Rhodanobacter sp. 7MK24]MBD8881390.1 hypothetical protein [Rhodanobacter sp. 7MK24]